MKRYIISDLHMSDRGKSDEFRGSAKDLMEFLKPIPDKSLILNGDIIDLLRCSLDVVTAAYRNELALLMQKAERYVAGNHDRDMLQYLNFMGVPIVEKLVLGNVLIMHGHQFDFVNEDGHVIGDIAARSLDWLADHVSAKVITWGRKFEQWLRKNGRFGTPTLYRDKSFQYISHFQIGTTAVKRIVLGHTHKKDHAMQGEFEYSNDGAWIADHRDFVVMDI